MKFGKYLAKRQLEIPEYSSYFINYKALKKLIKKLSQVDLNNKDGPKTPQDALQDNKAAFFFRLERELEKVNSFYLQKEAELSSRLNILLEKKKAVSLLSKNSISFLSLLEGLQRFRRDLDRLQQYVELNATGFSKVLKKWDKRSKSSTKELYLSRAVEVQPVFHRDVISRLSDVASESLLELQAHADGDSLVFERQTQPQLSSQKMQDEIDVEFIDSDEIENSDSLNRWVTALSSTPDAQQRITRIFLRAISTPRIKDAVLTQLFQSGFTNLKMVDEVNNRNCLHWAAITGRYSILQLGLKNGVDPTTVDIYNRTSLHYAAWHGFTHMLAPLVEATKPNSSTSASQKTEFLLNSHDQDNFSPLIFAIIHSHPECVTELIRLGATIEPASEQDYIPLNVACSHGLYEVSEILLKNKAHILPDAEGLFPQHLVARAGFSSLIPLLKKYNANIDQNDKLNGWTALFYAASEGHYTTTKALIDAGASIHITDEKKLNALYYAAWEGHIDIMELLANIQDSQNKSFHAISKMAKSNQSTLPMNTESNNSDSLSTFQNTNVFRSTSSGILKSLVDTQSKLGSVMANTAIYSNISNNDNSFSHDVDMSFSLLNSSDPDAIPDLSLPPPILPLRRYGHNFLDKKIFIRLSFDYDSKDSQPLIFYDDNDIPSVKLTVTSKISDIIPRSLTIPLSEDDRQLVFQVESLDNFRIDFEVYPTFGSRIIGRAVALPDVFKSYAECNSLALGRSGGHVATPLFDMRLRVIGEVRFNYTVILPFNGMPLELTNFETYWKSTSQIENGSPSPPIATVNVSSHFNNYLGSSNNSGANLLSSSIPVTLSTTNTSSTSLTSADGDKIMQDVNNSTLLNPNVDYLKSENHHRLQTLSFVTASSLSGNYARIAVQVTKDNIPIVCPKWKISVSTSVEIPVCELTLNQIRALLGENGFPSKNELQSRINNILMAKGVNTHTFNRDQTKNISALFHSTTATLEDILLILPSEISLDVELIYPTDIEASILEIPLSSLANLNNLVDSILSIVFDATRKLQSIVSASANSSSANFHNSSHASIRSLIFSAAHPAVCTVLNWKQPNFPVFFHCSSLSLSSSIMEATTASSDILLSDNENSIAEVAKQSQVNKNNGVHIFSYRSAHGFRVPPLSETRQCVSVKEATAFASLNNLMGIIWSAELMALVPQIVNTIRASGLVLIGQQSEKQLPADILNNTRNADILGIDALRDSEVLSFKDNLNM